MLSSCVFLMERVLEIHVYRSVLVSVKDRFLIVNWNILFQFYEK